MIRMFVVVATVGRAELASRTLDLLADQSRPPDGIMVVGVIPGDVEGIAAVRGKPEVVLGERGSCRQRNRALDLLAGRADIILFFDDDFVAAPDYLEQVERLFEEHPDVVGITGDLIADGIHSGGYTLAGANTLIAQRQVRADAPIRARQALYGCNMAIRVDAADGLRFDEALPLYGWQEDVDFSYYLARRGRLISSAGVTGVHLGAKSGRTSGRRLGYSQVANLVYLWRKGTMQPRLGEKLLFQNLMSNAVRSIRPEPHIDRRGRLLGNMLALADLARGRLDPGRIERM